MIDPFALPSYSDSDWRSLQELREEYNSLLDRYTLLTTLDAEGAHRPLAGIAGLARRYLPVEHHDAVTMLLRLAYVRGRCDEMERAGAPTIVLRACPACLGKREG